MDAETEARLKRADFTLDDFLTQIKQVRKMGGLGGILKSLPGAGKLTKEMDGEVDERALDRIEAIVFSMTLAERAKPQLINGARRERIARGSGVQVYDVNQLLKQFADTRKLMKQFQSASGKGKKRMRMVGNVAEVETYRSWGVKHAEWAPMGLMPISAPAREATAARKNVSTTATTPIHQWIEKIQVSITTARQPVKTKPKTNQVMGISM